jgi:pyruvate formate lyase activating enzyme
LKPVLDTIWLLKSLGVWVEVTTLVVPGQNDSVQELCDIARFIATSIGRDTPWHVSRFFPAYEMADLPPTAVESLQLAREIGLDEGLEYVYVGNIPGTQWENTLCPGCGFPVIERAGLGAVVNHTREDGCPRCGCHIAGIGLDWREIEVAEEQALL